ncbi:hypothetical protein RHGRI_016993 [Rhododendron griersonianum]|uniref:Endonuclease/exonuclease/phosphatase n=1 Tax=Rhododendron griersonianum TaxID=479676 RepID=A0AAV6JW88_9ERIC|nr:hypothetical protein RHGRI_016993 [Rhododendron griersonianum]
MSKISLGAWNVRGLNDPLKQKEVHSMIKVHRLGMMGVVEAKVRPENIDHVVKRCFPHSWSFLHNAYNDSVARIILGWDPQLFTVDMIHSSSQLLVVKDKILIDKIQELNRKVYYNNLATKGNLIHHENVELYKKVNLLHHKKKKKELCRKEQAFRTFPQVYGTREINGGNRNSLLTSSLSFGEDLHVPVHLQLRQPKQQNYETARAIKLG